MQEGTGLLKLIIKVFDFFWTLQLFFSRKQTKEACSPALWRESQTQPELEIKPNPTCAGILTKYTSCVRLCGPGKKGQIR